MHRTYVKCLDLLQLNISYFVDIHGRPTIPEQKQRGSALGGGNRGEVKEGLKGEEGGENEA